MVKNKLPDNGMIDPRLLKPNPLNVKNHTDEQIEKIAKLIDMVGFKFPVAIDNDLTIWRGHASTLAAIKRDLKKIPYFNISHLSKVDKNAYMIADNQANESQWNIENIQLVLEENPTLNPDRYDIDLTNISKKLGEQIIEDEVPEIPKKAKSKLGEIYQLGNHTIMCGDATIPKQLKALIDKKADLMLTDPPYGIDIVNHDIVGRDGGMGFTSGHKSGQHSIVKARKYSKITNDDKPFDPTFLLDLAKKIIIFGANHFSDKLPVNSHWIVWDKKDGSGADRNSFSDVELAWTNIKQKNSLIYRHLWSGLLRKGDRKTELKERIHPTQKPVGLMAEIIQDYSEEGDSVLDPYLGSGSALIACEQTNRICYGMEIEPLYVDVIIQRWENFTGQKAIKVSLKSG